MWWGATYSCALAFAQRDGDSHAAWVRVQTARRAFPNDRETQVLCCGLGARAALARGEAALALQLDDEGIERIRSPYAQPAGWLLRGDTLRELGEISAARDVWQRAAHSTLDTVSVKLARERLAQISES